MLFFKKKQFLFGQKVAEIYKIVKYDAILKEKVGNFLSRRYLQVFLLQ